MAKTQGKSFYFKKLAIFLLIYFSAIQICRSNEYTDELNQSCKLISWKVRLAQIPGVVIGSNIGYPATPELVPLLEAFFQKKGKKKGDKLILFAGARSRSVIVDSSMVLQEVVLIFPPPYTIQKLQQLAETLFRTVKNPRGNVFFERDGIQKSTESRTPVRVLFPITLTPAEKSLLKSYIQIHLNNHPADKISEIIITQLESDGAVSETGWQSIPEVPDFEVVSKNIDRGNFVPEIVKRRQTRVFTPQDWKDIELAIQKLNQRYQARVSVDRSGLEHEMGRALKDLQSNGFHKYAELETDLRQIDPESFALNPDIMDQIKLLETNANPSFRVAQSLVRLAKSRKPIPSVILRAPLQVLNLISLMASKVLDTVKPQKINRYRGWNYLRGPDFGLEISARKGSTLQNLRRDFDILSRITIDNPPDLVSEIDAAFLDESRGVPEALFRNQDGRLIAEPSLSSEKVYALEPEKVLEFRRQDFSKLSDSQQKRYYSIILPKGFVDAFSSFKDPRHGRVFHSTDVWANDPLSSNKVFLKAVERDREQIHVKFLWTFVLEGQSVTALDFLRMHVLGIVEWNSEFEIKQVKIF